MKLTRRDFFKGVGAGTALAGLSSMARPAPAAAKAAARSAQRQCGPCRGR